LILVQEVHVKAPVLKDALVRTYRDVVRNQRDVTQGKQMEKCQG
jgi:hypothetical protein